MEFKITSKTQINESEYLITIDECTNTDVYSDDINSHDYIFENVVNDEESDNSVKFRVIDEKIIGDVHYTTLEIYGSSIDAFDGNIKYIRLYSKNEENVFNVFAGQGLYYSPNMIYHAELRELKKVCYTCFDDKTMQLIMFITFKKQLLHDAIVTSHYKEALQYYFDLCRLLRIYVVNSNTDSECNGCILTELMQCIKQENSQCTLLENASNMSGCINGMCNI